MLVVVLGFDDIVLNKIVKNFSGSLYVSGGSKVDNKYKNE